MIRVNSPGDRSGPGSIVNENCVKMHEFVYFKSNGIYFQVAVRDICYMEAVSKYVKIVTPHKAHLATTSMWSLEKKLPQNLFCRIHRSFMVSLQHISRFDNETVYMDKMAKELPIGKQYKGMLQQRLFIINGDEKEINPLTVAKTDSISIIEFPRET